MKQMTSEFTAMVSGIASLALWYGFFIRSNDKIVLFSLALITTVLACLSFFSAKYPETPHLDKAINATMILGLIVPATWLLTRAIFH